LKELAGGSYDEKDTVSTVKKARAGEQQQLNLERIKAEIAEQNEKMAEENKENLTKNISSEENEVVEDAESENAEIDEELNEIEEESVDEDISEEDLVEEISEDLDNQSS
jgi:phage terminase small subunit